MSEVVCNFAKVVRRWMVLNLVTLEDVVDVVEAGRQPGCRVCCRLVNEPLPDGDEGMRAPQDGQGCFKCNCCDLRLLQHVIQPVGLHLDGGQMFCVVLGHNRGFDRQGRHELTRCLDEGLDAEH